jgi:transcriptional regulator with XRE-family HTH domain
MWIHYPSPSPEQLQALKQKLGYTGREMASLACVSPQHWRRYTGGADPKNMPYANLFHLAAQLTLDPSP